MLATTQTELQLLEEADAGYHTNRAPAVAGGDRRCFHNKGRRCFHTNGAPAARGGRRWLHHQRRRWLPHQQGSSCWRRRLTLASTTTGLQLPEEADAGFHTKRAPATGGGGRRWLPHQQGSSCRRRQTLLPHQQGSSCWRRQMLATKPTGLQLSGSSCRRRQMLATTPTGLQLPEEADTDFNTNRAPAARRGRRCFNTNRAPAARGGRPWLPHQSRCWQPHQQGSKCRRRQTLLPQQQGSGCQRRQTLASTPKADTGYHTNRAPAAIGGG